MSGDSGDERYFMREAVRLAMDSACSGGGPFGAVIVLDGQIIGSGSNRVTLDNDPTAHAEMEAIRAACRHLDSFSLEGCVLYASCEPCPMCLAAAYWARLERIHYAVSRHEAAQAGFDDALIYEEVCLPIGERSLPLIRQSVAAEDEPFCRWQNNPRRVDY